MLEFLLIKEEIKYHMNLRSLERITLHRCLFLEMVLHECVE